MPAAARRRRRAFRISAAPPASAQCCRQDIAQCFAPASSPSRVPPPGRCCDGLVAVRVRRREAESRRDPGGGVCRHDRRQVRFRCSGRRRRASTWRRDALSADLPGGATFAAVAGAVRRSGPGTIRRGRSSARALGGGQRVGRRGSRAPSIGEVVRPAESGAGLRARVWQASRESTRQRRSSGCVRNTRRSRRRSPRLQARAADGAAANASRPPARSCRRRSLVGATLAGALFGRKAISAPAPSAEPPPPHEASAGTMNGNRGQPSGRRKRSRPIEEQRRSARRGSARRDGVSRSAPDGRRVRACLERDRPSRGQEANA